MAAGEGLRVETTVPPVTTVKDAAGHALVDIVPLDDGTYFVRFLGEFRPTSVPDSWVIRPLGVIPPHPLPLDIVAELAVG